MMGLDAAGVRFCLLQVGVIQSCLSGLDFVVAVGRSDCVLNLVLFDPFSARSFCGNGVVFMKIAVFLCWCYKLGNGSRFALGREREMKLMLWREGAPL